MEFYNNDKRFEIKSSRLICRYSLRMHQKDHGDPHSRYE